MQLMKGPFLAIILIGIDAWAKWFALTHIHPLQGSCYPFEGIAVCSCQVLSFSLNLLTNTGAAWGLFPHHPLLLLVLRLAILALLCIYLFLRRGGCGTWKQTPLWFILSGATGNIIDMLCYGYVVDLFHVRFLNWSFPIFNLADSYITIGAFLLLLPSIRWGKQHAH